MSGRLPTLMASNQPAAMAIIGPARQQFSTVKFELGETFESIRRGKELAFDYIEVFYNRQRRHSSIGYRTPAEHERRFHDRQLAVAA
jgi:transposase InsO family protein